MMPYRILLQRYKYGYLLRILNGLINFKEK